MRLGSEKWDFWKRRGRKKTMETAKYQEPFRVSPSSLSLKAIFISMVSHLLLWSCHHYQGKDIAKYREPFRVSPTLQWHLSPPSGTFFARPLQWWVLFIAFSRDRIKCCSGQWYSKYCTYDNTYSKCPQIHSHTCFSFSKYLQVPKSDFHLGEENLQNGAPPTHAAGASKKSFPHIKMFVNICGVNICPMIFGIGWLSTQCSFTLQNHQCCPNFSSEKNRLFSSVVS